MEYLMTSQIQMLVDNGNIHIEGMDQQLLERDHYRFRAKGFKVHDSIVPAVTLKPLEYVLCLSYERFKTSGIVVGDISQISDNALAGLILNKSDYVDRRFAGRLRLGLFNMTNRDISLKKGDVIGKIYFYKVCDADWCGCFDTKIDHAGRKTSLDRRFEHRATTDDIEEPMNDFGKQWV